MKETIITEEKVLKELVENMQENQMLQITFGEGERENVRTGSGQCQAGKRTESL